MDCQCFSLCGVDAAADFHARLPRRASASSPWAGYLRAVYGEDVAFPFAVAKLHFFWADLLPTAMHLCPKPHVAPEQPVLPSCPPAHCEGWLEDAADTRHRQQRRQQEEEDQQRRRQQQRESQFGAWASWIPQQRSPQPGRASFIWPPLWPPFREEHSPLNASPKLRRKLPHNQFLLIQPHERAPALNGTWMEVIRVIPPNLVPGVAVPECDAHYGWQRECQVWQPGSDWPYQPHGYVQRQDCLPLGCCREGRNYGCWFWPARGSGIYVNVGRSQVLRSRSDAEHSGFGARAVVFNAKYGRNVTVRMRGNDCMFARVARDLHLDSVQVLRANRQVFTGQSTAPAFELVLAAPACTHPSEVLQHACPPVTLRAGERAQKTCACSSAAEYAVLNCAAGGADGGRAA